MRTDLDGAVRAKVHEAYERLLKPNPVPPYATLADIIRRAKSDRRIALQVAPLSAQVLSHVERDLGARAKAEMRRMRDARLRATAWGCYQEDGEWRYQPRRVMTVRHIQTAATTRDELSVRNRIEADVRKRFVEEAIQLGLGLDDSVAPFYDQIVERIRESRDAAA